MNEKRQKMCVLRQKVFLRLKNRGKSKMLGF